jgi:hypothetical protein
MKAFKAAIYVVLALMLASCASMQFAGHHGKHHGIGLQWNIPLRHEPIPIHAHPFPVHE